MKTKNLLCIFLCLVTAYYEISAQEKIVKESELNALIEQASAKLKTIKYRVKVIHESSVAPALDQINRFERVPPDREHFISERKVGDRIERYETITVKRKTYVKFGDEEWQLQVGGGGVGSGSGGEDDDVEKLTENKYIGKVNLNNQKVDLYEVTSINKRRLSEMEYVVTKRERYWFGDNGLFVKTVSETQYGRPERFSRVTQEFEYDANLKIEAPIVKNKSKRNTKQKR